MRLTILAFVAKILHIQFKVAGRPYGASYRSDDPLRGGRNQNEPLSGFAPGCGVGGGNWRHS